MGRMRGDTRRCPDSKYSTPMPRGKLSLMTAVVRALPSSFVALLSSFLLMATPSFTQEQITWLQAALPLGTPLSSPGPSATPPLLAQQSEAGRTDDRLAITFSECARITKLNCGSNYGKFGGNSSQYWVARTHPEGQVAAGGLVFEGT